MRKIQRIGVFDSGLGGLTVLSALIKKIPQASYFYLGDTARTPYGSKSPEVVERYALECARFLDRRHVDLLVVACNTASSLALDSISQSVRCPVVGTIEPAIAQWEKLGAASPLGIIGTRATISSAAYQTRLCKRFPRLAVSALACPLFVPLVEEGLTKGPIVDEVIRHYLTELQIKNLGALILACTHYPLLASAISSYLGAGVQIIDSAEAIADEVSRNYQIGSLSGTPERRFFVTDDVARFSTLATLFLGADGAARGNVSAELVQLDPLEERSMNRAAGA